MCSHDPELATPSGLTPGRFRLIPFRSPLLRESHLLSFPRVTEMFQFTRFPLPALCVQTGVTPHDGCRVSPFGHPRVKAWSAAHRGFSQPPTSFIGSRRQGIHRWPFVAWKNKDARARYAILKGRVGRQHGSDQQHWAGRRAGDAFSFSTELSSRLRRDVDRRRERVLCTPSKRNRGRRHRSVDGGEPESSIRHRHHAAE